MARGAVARARALQRDFVHRALQIVRNRIRRLEERMRLRRDILVGLAERSLEADERRAQHLCRVGVRREEVVVVVVVCG